MALLDGLRHWYWQRRLRLKTQLFIRLAVNRGWTTARLPHPSALVSGKVLVLAAHVDDEAVGCGGTLWLHRQQGQPVHVAYVLDDLHEQAVREQEGNRVATFLGARVTHLRCSREVSVVADTLATLIEREQPAITYVPWVLDNHEDHQLVTHALSRVLAQGLDCGTLWCYEVWTPLIPNRIVDITAVADKKASMLAYYQSQMAKKDMVSLGIGLAHYRGGLLAGRAATAAEVFCALDSKAYQETIQRVKS